MQYMPGVVWSTIVLCVVLPVSLLLVIAVPGLQHSQPSGVRCATGISLYNKLIVRIRPVQQVPVSTRVLSHCEVGHGTTSVLNHLVW